MKRFIIATFCTCFLMSGSAFAVVITGPLTYDTSNLVGTAAPGVAASNVAQEVIWAQAILDLAAGTTSGIYQTHNTDEYADTLTTLGAYQGGSGTVDAGYDYVLAKYDGQNGGYVLFYIGGEQSTIPTTSDNIWVNSQENGYGLSHWTVFNSTTRKVAEPGSLALLGAGLFAFGLLRRRKRLG